jgi:dTDP-glucose 4,6-dehydratase
MRVVVTGGAGFVGSHLCERLLGQGHRVVCLDNFSTGDPQNVAHLREHPNFTVRSVNIANPVQVPGPVHLVLHFASPASPPDYLTLPIQTLKVGALGTLHMLGMAKDKRARFVLASTSEAYGDPQVHPQPEHYWGHVNPVGPRSVYDEAKRFAEALTMSYRREHGVRTGIVRIFNTSGPRMRPIQYIDDLVDGVLLMARSDHPGPINLGNPTEISILRLAETIRDLVGSSSPISFVPRPQDDPTVRCPDITLAREVLGWTPQVPFEDGLRRTIAWFARELSLAPA